MAIVRDLPASVGFCLGLGLSVWILLILGSGGATASLTADNPAIDNHAGVTPSTAVTGGENGTDRLVAIAETDDGGYVVAGRTDSQSSSTQGWLVKLDGNGSEDWNRTYGGGGFDTFRAVAPTSDGGYLLAGTSESTPDGSFDAWLVKVDAEGAVEWAEQYGGDRYDGARDVVTTGGEYAFAGVTRSRGPGRFSAWVVGVDGTGAEVWNRTYGGGQDDIATALVTDDAGYVVGGTSESFTEGSAGWVIAINDTGEKRWSHRPQTSASATGTALAYDSSSDAYLLAGDTVPDGGGPTNAWVARVAADGTEAWNRTYGGGGPDIATGIVTTDDGIVFTGATESFQTSARDVWTVQVASDGDVTDQARVARDGRQTASALVSAGDGFAIAGQDGYTNSDGLFLQVTLGDDAAAGEEGSDTGAGGSGGGGSDLDASGDDTGSTPGSTPASTPAGTPADAPTSTAAQPGAGTPGAGDGTATAAGEATDQLQDGPSATGLLGGAGPLPVLVTVAVIGVIVAGLVVLRRRGRF